MISRFYCLLFLLFLLPPLQAETVSDEAIQFDPDVMRRWNEISQMTIGPRSQAFIEEGQRVLDRFTELEALEAKASGDSLKLALRVDIAGLKLTFMNILRSIEQATLFDQSPEELRSLRDRYLQERAELDLERQALRDKAIDRGDHFLDVYRRDPDLQRYSQREVVAKLCLRLAELHYDRSEEHYFARMDSLLNLLEAELPVSEQTRNQDAAVNRYKRIIDEFPWSDFMDDALYAVAYVYENSRSSSEVEESRHLYEQLVRDFPQSRYAAESWMRLGEFWFREKGEDALLEAVYCYEHVLDYEEYNAQEKALYKLGWCHYRLGMNKESVDYFAEAAMHAKTLETEGLGRADLLDESVSYIAVNFADADWSDSGVGAMATFLHERDALREDLGFALLNRLGDLHHDETQDFHQAVSAYDTLLVFYPVDERAPWIQEKVISCYDPGALNRPELAYAEKSELFDNWGSSLTAGASEDLSGLLREHLSETVTQSRTRAYGSELKVDLEEFVDQTRRFLKSFPEDTLAYDFHWNMALTLEKKLEVVPDAFAEYLAISRQYPVEKVRDAAYNAIVLGQILVDQELSLDPVEPDSLASDLTAAEESKREALENFAELFPEDEATPGYILLAGKQYYNHHDFTVAGEYFDRLITGWPASVEVNEAYRLKLEALFALGLFAEAEGVALEIQALDPDGDFAMQARSRQAESQYAYASQLKEGSNHLEAAEEFLRMARDVPDAPFADASLFDAANEFIEAGFPDRASDAYIELTDTHPASMFADRALSLAGFLFLEDLDDYSQAALIFDRLTTEYQASEYFRTALTNAAFCYEKTEQWVHTIRMNQLYVDRFPDSDDAPLVLFDNAGLYLKLDDEISANRIYADFAARYPSDPRTVEAFLERGLWLLGRGDQDGARAEFEQAAVRNRELLLAGADGNPLAASQALRHLVRRDVLEFDLITLSDLNRMDDDIQQLRSLRDRLLDRLDELIALGTGDVFYARITLADVHASFARIFREQQRPSISMQDEAIRQEVALQDASHELSLLAAQSYIETTHELEAAHLSLEQQKAEIADSRLALDSWLASVESDSLRAPEDSLAQRLALLKAQNLLEASLAESAMWSSRARDKVPQVLLENLELRESRIPMVLGMRSTHKRDVFMRMADRDRNILSGAGFATVSQLIEGYREALELIAEVGLERLYRSRVEERLNIVLSYLPSAYREFRIEVWTEFDAGIDRFLEVVEQGEDFVDRKGLAEEDYGNDVLDLADFNQTYTLNAITIYARLLEVLDAQHLSRNLGATLSDSLAMAALDTRKSLLERANRVDGLREEYWKRFEESASYVFRDAFTTLEDAAYFTRMASREVLLAAEPTVTATAPATLPARRLLFALAQEDPERFGDRFGLQDVTFELHTDASWLAREDYAEGFDQLDGPTEGWYPAEVLGAGVFGSSLWSSKDASSPSEQTSSQDSTQNIVAVPDVPKAFLQKRFNLNGTPLGASLKLEVDDAVYIFFNGEYIDEVINEADSMGVYATTGSLEYDLSEFLQEGDNLLAFEVEDRDYSGKGFSATLSWREMARLTEDLFEQQLQEELARQQDLDFQQRMNRLYDKNRVD